MVLFVFGVSDPDGKVRLPALCFLGDSLVAIRSSNGIFVLEGCSSHNYNNSYWKKANVNFPDLKVSGTQENNREVGIH